MAGRPENRLRALQPGRPRLLSDGEHYHILIETPDGNLSKGMRQLNGVYTQRFNRTHNRVGHVFQGRYKAILVQKDAYLLELSRYIVLNQESDLSGFRCICGRDAA